MGTALQGAGFGANMTLASYDSFASLALGAGSFSTGGESWFEFVARYSVTLSKFGAYVTANTRSTDTEIRTRKNGADGGQLLSVTTGTTGFFADASGSDSLVDGDTFDAVVRTGSGTGLVTIERIWCQADSTSPFAYSIAAVYRGTRPSISAGATRYGHVVGLLPAALYTSEGDASRHTVRTPGSAHAFQVVVVSNTNASASDAAVRVNGADSALTVSITGSTTGLFEDTTHSATLADGDTIGFRISAASGTGTIQLTSVGLVVEPSDPYSEVAATGSTARSSSTTTYWAGLLGYLAIQSSAEEQAQTVIPWDTHGTRLRVVNQSHSGADTTVKLRVDGADGAQAVSLTGSGVFEDTTGTDVLGAGAKVCVQIESGAASSDTFLEFALRLGETVAAPGGQSVQLFAAM